MKYPIHILENASTGIRIDATRALTEFLQKALEHEPEYEDETFSMKHGKVQFWAGECWYTVINFYEVAGDHGLDAMSNVELLLFMKKLQMLFDNGDLTPIKK